MLPRRSNWSYNFLKASPELDPTQKVTCKYVAVDKQKAAGSGGRLADCRAAPVGVLGHVLATPCLCTTNKSYTRGATSRRRGQYLTFHVLSYFGIVMHAKKKKKKTRSRFLPSQGYLPCQRRVKMETFMTS